MKIIGNIALSYVEIKLSQNFQEKHIGKPLWYVISVGNFTKYEILRLKGQNIAAIFVNITETKTENNFISC